MCFLCRSSRWDRAHTCVPGPQAGRRGAPGSQASFLLSPSLARAGWGWGQHTKPHTSGRRSLCHPLAPWGSAEVVGSRTTWGQRAGDLRTPRAKLADLRSGSATWWTLWRLQQPGRVWVPAGVLSSPRRAEPRLQDSALLRLRLLVRGPHAGPAGKQTPKDRPTLPRAPPQGHTRTPRSRGVSGPSSHH